MKPFVKHNFTRDQVLRANEAMNRGDTSTLQKSAPVVSRVLGDTRSTAAELNQAFDAAQRSLAKAI
ncbi:hypothetical protein HA052_24565 [Chromobacterium haemolyticum]|uniref:Uncharacterized protein n=1 Tax=Chromobacterium fluminis TaxID=3044269 RepID=A0ABX0LFN3_9NEIS|nr:MULTISPECIES: hypothetical protein [Chromobacterium]NHR08369.1 hypothetical protein [Chromobacterium haemolyticum]